LSELFAITTLDSDVVAASGIVCDEDSERVQWSGGIFTSENTILEPYIGGPLSESGYHGQLYCQRCVDVAAPTNFIVRRDFLKRVLRKFKMTRYESLMVSLGIEAALSKKYIATTPHIKYHIPRGERFPIPDDREGLLERVEKPEHLNRWYNVNLAIFTRQSYTIQERPTFGLV